MEIDAFLPTLAQLGAPGIWCVVLLYALNKYVPRAIEAYSKAKEADRKADDGRVREYNAMLIKTTEVLTRASVMAAEIVKALEIVTDVDRKVVGELEAIERLQCSIMEGVGRDIGARGR